MEQPWLRGRPVMVLLLALVGCEPELVVELAAGPQALPAPSFVIRAEAAEAPRVDVIRVYETGADEALVWHLRAAPPGPTSVVGGLTYGVAPAGYETVAGAEPLRAGSEYVLVVSGTGHGQLRFVVRADGAVAVRS